jgi:hypothetical protein
MIKTVKTTTTIALSILMIGAVSCASLHAKDLAGLSSARQTKKSDDSKSLAQKYAADLHNHIHKFDMKHSGVSINQAFAADSQSLRKKFVGNKRLEFDVT